MICFKQINGTLSTEITANRRGYSGSYDQPPLSHSQIVGLLIRHRDPMLHFFQCGFLLQFQKENNASICYHT